MIVFDTESTGLMRPAFARLSEQPHLIEIAALRTDDMQTFHALIKPPVPITGEIAKITGITQEMVANAEPVASVLPKFAYFVLGQDTWVAHNLAHDVGIVTTELTRAQAQYKFPYPMRHLCTVEHTSDMELPDRKLTTLYKALFDAPLKQTHRALDDVLALWRCVEELQARGRMA
jgi:DNA polymerase-3 subunit alpha (Gram-positive type)